MRLSELVKRDLSVDPEIAGVTADSRRVRPGYLFAALPGAKVDGRDFARRATEQGAVAVLAGRGIDGMSGLQGVGERRRANRLDADHARLPAGVPRGDAAQQAIVLGTPNRTATLNQPVTNTTITGNVAAIPTNPNPYRWVHGQTNTVFTNNTSLGRPVGCPGAVVLEDLEPQLEGLGHRPPRGRAQAG